MALTPEEQKELEMIEAEEASLMQSSLSPEEERELAQLEAEESGQPVMEEPIDNADVARNILQETEIDMEDFQSRRGAQALGAVEGIPFVKDILAGSEAMIDIATTEAELSDFGERYNNNKDEWDKEINRAEQKHPGAFLSGEMVSGALIPGQALIGRTVTSTIGKSAAFGGLSGLSRSENRQASDVIEGAALGAAGGAVGESLSRGASALGKFLKGKVIAGVGEVAGGVGARNKKVLNDHVRRHYGKTADITVEEQTERFASDILNETVDGKPFLTSTQTFNDTAVKAGTKREVYGNQIGKVLKEMDDTVGKLDTKQIHSDIKVSLDDMLDSDDTATRKLGEKLLSEVDDAFGVVRERMPVKRKISNNETGALEEITELIPTGKMEFTKEMNISRLHKYKTDIAKKAKFQSQNRDMAAHTKSLQTRVGILSNHIEEVVDASGSELVGSFSELNRKYANMTLVENMASEVAVKGNEGISGTLRNVLRTYGTNVGFMAAAGGLGVGASTALSVGVNSVLNSDRLPAAMTKSADTLSRHITNNPNSHYVKRLITQAAIGQGEFNTALSNVVGELNLYENKVKRTVEDVKLKSDDILPTVEFYNKELASNLRDAIKNDNDEAIAQTMDQISKLPEAKNFMDQGIGFNGKVHSPEDKQLLIDQVDSMDMSLHQKLMHKKGLRDKGLIPQMQPEEPQDTGSFLQRRDKNKPKY